VTDNKQTIGYFIVKIGDLASAVSTTSPPNDIPLTFRFAIDSKGNRLDTIGALNGILDMGSMAVALLWRDMKSNKVSVGYPASLPVWLRTVVSNRAEDVIADVLRRLPGNCGGSSQN
jgi:hypothetical protein